MHEQQKGRKAEKLDFINSRYGGYWLPTVHGRDRLGSLTYIYSYDGGTWSYYTDSYSKELTHNIAIVIASAGAFGAGIGFLIIKLLGGW